MGKLLIPNFLIRPCCPVLRCLLHNWATSRPCCIIGPQPGQPPRRDDHQLPGGWRLTTYPWSPGLLASLGSGLELDVISAELDYLGGLARYIVHSTAPALTKSLQKNLPNRPTGPIWSRKSRCQCIYIFLYLSPRLCFF